MKSPEPIRRIATLVGHGHPEITAKHPKTFELTGEAEITRRASCVVGVGTRFDAAALAEWSLLRGPVRLTLTATAPDGTVREAVGEAVVNPRHDVADRIVIRRSPLSADTADDDVTWATDSTLTSTDLDASFAAALADPATRVELTAEEIGDRRPLILVLDGWPTSGLSGRARWLWAQAGLVRGGGPRRAGFRKTGEWLADVHDVAAGEIVAVVLDSLSEPPHPTVAAFLATVSRETAARFAILPAGPGPLVALEALLASGLPLAPYAWLGSPQRLSELPATATVLRMPGAVPPEVFGDRRVAVADTAEADLGTAVSWVPAAEAVGRVGALTVVAPASDPGERVDLDAVARALAAAGIAPRTLSEALTPFGLTRKKLYALLKDDD